MFAAGDPDRPFAYYLGLEAVDGRRFTPMAGSDVPFVRRWGLDVLIGDLRRVVRAARAGGRRTVFLGGHNTGGR